MDYDYLEEQTFTNKDFTGSRLPEGEYAFCEFINCNFAKSSLAGIRFEECTFTECDLSLTDLTDTKFQEVTFDNCKMLGINFEDCNYKPRFRTPFLRVASFTKPCLQSVT